MISIASKARSAASAFVSRATRLATAGPPRIRGSQDFLIAARPGKIVDVKFVSRIRIIPKLDLTGTLS